MIFVEDCAHRLMKMNRESTNSPHKYIQLASGKGAKAVHQEEQFSQEIILEQLESKGKMSKQIVNFDLNLTPHTKINST